MPVKSPPWLLLALGLGALASILAALSLGAVTLTPARILALIGGESTGMDATLVFELRLPRALNAFATGGLLALAGVLMQVLLRNPLADPYILGTSGGAAVSVLALMQLGYTGLWLNGGAFLGALASTLLVFGLAHGAGGWTSNRLLLTGVVIASGWGALISFILTIATDSNLKSMLFWLIGDLGFGPLQSLPAALLAIGSLAALMMAPSLNIAGRGELQAQALGVDTGALRYRVYLLASLLTAAAVVMAGSIGFVGLVVPHALRLLAGSDHRWLIPASVLAGGGLLVLADTLARTLFAPQQIPVGVITALLGVPLFLFLLNRSRTA